MNAFKKSVIVLFILFLTSACNNGEQTPRPVNSSSWEQNGTDTCNLTVNGLKQGKWYVYENSSSGRVIKDTVYYRDGKVVEKGN